jgi:hypothetical protein
VHIDIAGIFLTALLRGIAIDASAVWHACVENPSLLAAVCVLVILAVLARVAAPTRTRGRRGTF